MHCSHLRYRVNGRGERPASLEEVAKAEEVGWREEGDLGPGVEGQGPPPGLSQQGQVSPGLPSPPARGRGRGAGAGGAGPFNPGGGAGAAARPGEARLRNHRDHGDGQDGRALLQPRRQELFLPLPRHLPVRGPRHLRGCRG